MKVAYLAIVASLLLGVASANAGALVANKTVDIKFNGFCDGMHLVINQNSGLVTGNQTGCSSGKIVGTVGANSSLGAGVSILASGLLYVIDDAPQNWKNYQTTGALLNSGTYSVGVAAAAASGRASSAR